MSVGHSRRTSRSSSPSAARLRRELLLEIALDAVLLEPGRLAHLVRHVAQHLDEADLEAVLLLPARLRDDQRRRASSTVVGGVIQFRGLYPPASAWTRTEPSSFSISEPRRLGQDGVEAPGVANLAAGDDEAHGARSLLARSDMARDRP